ncbi:hypothetical protein D3C72_2383020 [compost metagenome]
MVEVALRGGEAAVGHPDGFDLAGRGNARDTLFQIGAAAVRAGGHGAGAHEQLEPGLAGFAVVVKHGHGGLLGERVGWGGETGVGVSWAVLQT